MSDPTPPSPTQHPGQAVDLDLIKKQLNVAADLVGKLASGTERWKMSIPAQPDRDSDLILADAIGGALALLADLDAAREELRRVEQQRDDALAQRDKSVELIVKACDERDEARRGNAGAASQTWTMPPQPDGVTAVVDAEGHHWHLDACGEWFGDDEEPDNPFGTPWAELLSEFGPLTAAVDTYETQEGTG